MGSNTATVKHQTSVEIPQICLDSRFCTVHPFPFPEVQVHEDNSQIFSIHKMYAVMWLTCTSGMSSGRHVPGKGPKGKAFGSSVQGELMIP